MPRIARVVAVGLPHHITQRGNYRQDVFVDDNDRTQYLSWLNKYSVKFDLSILAFCLMQNHVHLIAIPNREDSLSKVFNAVHMRYSQYFNRKRKIAGHLWQSRFYSCVLDEFHLMAAARYIERNPVRAHIVNKPWHWKWSSAQFHSNNKQPLLKLGNLFKLIDIPRHSWKEFIDSGSEQKAVENIRKHTLAGRPLGTMPFIERLEKKFGRRLRALSRGRPKKKHNK